MGGYIDVVKVLVESEFGSKLMQMESQVVRTQLSRQAYGLCLCLYDYECNYGDYGLAMIATAKFSLTE
jgi:hypothetical protein